MNNLFLPFDLFESPLPLPCSLSLNLYDVITKKQGGGVKEYVPDAIIDFNAWWYIGNIAENLAEIKKKKNWIQNFLSAFPLSLKYLQVILS